MKKKVLAVILSLLIICGIIVGAYFASKKMTEINNLPKYRGLPVYEIHSRYVYDVSTKEKKVGVSDYVFVGRIDKIDRTEYRNGTIKNENDKKKNLTDPNTIYSVEVIENIKGELPESAKIEVVQNGGLSKNKKSYEFIDDGRLLEENEYYIILASVPFDEGELFISRGDSYKIIKDYSADSNIIKEYKDAYENQEVPTSEDGILSVESHKSKYDLSYSN